MNYSPLLSIIIPTYKEAGNIKNLIEEILEFCEQDSLEILVVDDNSQDGIDEQIRMLYDRGINVTLLQRLENRGLATAVKFGMDRANGKSSRKTGGRQSQDTVEKTRKTDKQKDI